MGTGVVIGVPGPGHAGEVLTVQRAAYVTGARRYRAPGIPPLVETLDELRADLTAPGVVARAARRGQRPVGSVRGRLSGPAMEVARLTVAPDVAGLGVGRALLAPVHAAAPPEVTTCWLVTGPRSAADLRLCAAAGYAPVGTVVDPAGVEPVRLERPAVAVGGRS